jgi:methionyl-tRNA synthetase
MTRSLTMDSISSTNMPTSSTSYTTDYQSFFLMPIPPTPNGRLHLGHIAGPYLRMDMLGRYLRSQGHHVRVVSAVDGFDSYVQWKAVQERRDPRDVCQDYHAAISRDLRSLCIDVDGFLDLVQGPYAARHAHNTQRVLRELEELGFVEHITEHVLYSRETGRYIVGAWAVGRCPHCHAKIAGYFCEACGAHFRPESIVDLEPRLGDASLELRAADNLFLRVHDQTALLKYVASTGAPDALAEVVRRFLDQEDGLVRLTATGEWGVPWHADRFGNPRVIFESGWEYALTCGDWYVDHNAGSCHPMSRESKATTIVSFGIDNAILLLAGSGAVLDQPFLQAGRREILNEQTACNLGNRDCRKNSGMQRCGSLFSCS